MREFRMFKKLQPKLWVTSNKEINESLCLHEKSGITRDFENIPKIVFFYFDEVFFDFDHFPLFSSLTSYTMEIY